MPKMGVLLGAIVLAAVAAAGPARADVPSSCVAVRCACDGGEILHPCDFDCAAYCTSSSSGGANAAAPAPPAPPKPNPVQQAQLDAARSLGAAFGARFANWLFKPSSTPATDALRALEQQREAERIQKLKEDEERRKREAEQAKLRQDRIELGAAMKGAPVPDELQLKDTNAGTANFTAGLHVTALTSTSCYRTDPTKSGCVQIRNNSTKLARLYVEGLPGVQCTAPPGSYCTIPLAVGPHHLRVVPDDPQGAGGEAALDLKSAGVQLTLFGGTPPP